MVGILANSASVAMTSGDNPGTSTGYVTGEQITLTLQTEETSYSWSVAKPTNSGIRAALSAATGTSVTFVPDVQGRYVVTCLASGATTYVLRFEVDQAAAVTVSGAVHWLMRTAASVPTPILGRTMFADSALEKMRLKLPDGSTEDVAVPMLVYDRDGNVFAARSALQTFGIRTTDNTETQRIELRANSPTITVHVQRVGGTSILAMLTDLDITIGDMTIASDGTGVTRIIPPTGVLSLALPPRATLLGTVGGTIVSENLAPGARVRTFNQPAFGSPAATNFDFLLDLY